MLPIINMEERPCSELTCAVRHGEMQLVWVPAYYKGLMFCSTACQLAHLHERLKLEDAIRELDDGEDDANEEGAVQQPVVCGEASPLRTP